MSAGKVFVCAGEPSGDLYASLFIKRSKMKIGMDPASEIYGVGGPEMKKAGVNIMFGYQHLMSFGFAAGIVSADRNYRIYREVAQAIYLVKPAVFIAVAYPGVNLLLCRYAKKLGAKVYYLMPPQIWAWGEFRKYFIKKWVDTVISALPFEYRYYVNLGIDTIYIENPLIEELKKYKRNDFHKRIGVMPGSRPGEIKRNLPVILNILPELRKENPGIDLCVILHEKATALRICSPAFNFEKRYGDINDRYQAMRNCDLLVTCSGTASLEAAIMSIPQVFINRPSFFDYHLFRHFIRIKEYNLANLFFEKPVVPSIIARSIAKIKKTLMEILTIEMT